jgi:hypothetical protein
MAPTGLLDRFLELSREELNRYCADQQEENLHLDFKSLADRHLKSADDKRNFAKALSGFANSDGGIVVWGVDARKNESGVDCAQQPKPIGEVAALIPRLNSLTSDLVSPSVDGVQHRLVYKDTNGSGCAATFIPPSDVGPHMAKATLDRYYKRSGDSFLKMEHFEVADMFGRRPSPSLRLIYQIPPAASYGSGVRMLRIVLAIENTGRGTARAPYLAVRVDAPFSVNKYGVDGNGHEGLPRLVSRESAFARYGDMADTVIHPGTSREVLALGGDWNPSASPAIDACFSYELAAEGMPLTRGDMVIRADAILAAVQNA